MTAYFPGNTTITFSIVAGDHVYVGRDVTMTSPGNAILSSGNFTVVNVDGTLISSGGNAITLNAVANAGFNHLTIGSTGAIRSLSTNSSAIYLLGSDSFLQNWGEVTGVIGAWVENANNTHIQNYGLIAGNGYTIGGHGLVLLQTLSAAVENAGTITGLNGIDIRGGSSATVVNNGEISGVQGGVAIMVATGNTVGLTLSNSGVLQANVTAVSATDVVDSLRNTGAIHGDVLLFAGDDSLINAGAGTVFGKVDGGAGNDLLRGAVGEDEFLGGDGNDVLIGRAGDDVLKGGIGNDSLLGQGDDDSLLGEDGNDTVSGGFGSDTLSGGAGADKLAGDAGDDRLTGGAAADAFIFNRAAGHDLVTDFQNGADKIDISAFGLTAANYAAAVAPAVKAAVGGVAIDFALLGGSGSVLVKGLLIAQVDVTDFVF